MLFSSLFVPSRLADAVGDEAWIGAMVEVEAALARAEARAGVIPTEAAEAIVATCRTAHIDTASIVREARQVGNPAETLVRALRREVPPDAAQFVHLGATSQDIVDTAGVLITERALAIVERDLAGVAERLAGLAAEYRETLMSGRTLLQQALPITFGLKAAGWLAGVQRARSALRRLHDDALAVQFGGAAGTLASLGESGVAVLHELAAELELAEPALPWHTERSRIAEIGVALGLTSGVLSKVALDLVLLAQTEVGEVIEGGSGRQGGSSTLPHKHNPVGAVLTRACAREAEAGVEVLLRAMEGEHERAAGAWHSEWPALSLALAATGGAASSLRDALDRLEVCPERMRSNLEAAGGLIMAERAASMLASCMGREEAHDLLRSLAGKAVAGGTDLRAALLADERVRGCLSPDEIERATEPASYLGSTDTFIDRALALYKEGEQA